MHTKMPISQEYLHIFKNTIKMGVGDRVEPAFMELAVLWGESEEIVKR